MEEVTESAGAIPGTFRGGPYLLWCAVIIVMAVIAAVAVQRHGASARVLPAPGIEVDATLPEAYQAWKREGVHGAQLLVATGQWPKVDPKTLHELTVDRNYPLKLFVPAEDLERNKLQRETVFYTAMFTGVVRRLFVLLPQPEFASVAAASREVHNRRESAGELYTTYQGFPRHFRQLGPAPSLGDPAILLVTAGVFEHTTPAELVRNLERERSRIVRVYAVLENDNPTVSDGARQRLREFVALLGGSTR